MQTTNLFLGFIKPQLLILVPLTWAVGKSLKDAGVVGSGITRAIYIIDYLLAVAVGLLDKGLPAWRWVLQAAVVYGSHGVVCAYMATTLYDLTHDEIKAGRGR